MSHATPNTVVHAVPTVETFARNGKCSGSGTRLNMQPEEAIKQAVKYIVQSPWSHRAGCDFALCLIRFHCCSFNLSLTNILKVFCFFYFCSKHCGVWMKGNISQNVIHYCTFHVREHEITGSMCVCVCVIDRNS